MTASTFRSRVLLFAGLAQRAGTREWSVELLPGTTVAALRATLAALHPWLREVPTAVAINQALAQGEQIVQAGDEIALLPPVSGG